jgi:hypothetical protein
LGYYIRVLGTRLNDVPIADLRTAASPALIDVDDRGEPAWQQFILKHQDGTEIALVEKNLVAPGELGADELQEFLEEVPLHSPESAVAWLKEYLPSVKVIYAFQLLSGTDVKNGWTLLHSVYNAVWKYAGGILQADGEGFSNEEGYTILWQFGESVSGPWNVGVLIKGRWLHFGIELGNPQHREAFWEGRIPGGVTVLN